MPTYAIKIEVEDADTGSIATTELHIEAQRKASVRKIAKHLLAQAAAWDIEDDDIIKVED